MGNPEPENPAANITAEEDRPTPEILVTVGLVTEEVREELLLSRERASREQFRALWISGFAGFLIGLETWGVMRGMPVFGWLIPVLFVGFGVYFWFRRRHTKDRVSSLEEELKVLETERERISGLRGPPMPPSLAEGADGMLRPLGLGGAG
jgi:hypothetical protein